MLLHRRGQNRDNVEDKKERKRVLMIGEMSSVDIKKRDTHLSISLAGLPGFEPGK